MVCVSVCVFPSYSEFIDPTARTMVNLSAEAFEEAQKDLDQPSRYSFSLAQVLLVYKEKCENVVNMLSGAF